jgi:uncharacterized cupin superfamily protein
MHGGPKAPPGWQGRRWGEEAMAEIKITRKAEEPMLKAAGVSGWPIWEKEVSEFPWAYSEEETCYFLEGEVEVTPEGGEPVSMGKGDLVTFPEGMRCTWKIIRPVKKHYRLG